MLRLSYCTLGVTRTHCKYCISTILTFACMRVNTQYTNMAASFVNIEYQADHFLLYVMFSKVK